MKSYGFPIFPVFFFSQFSFSKPGAQTAGPIITVNGSNSVFWRWADPFYVHNHNIQGLGGHFPQKPPFLAHFWQIAPIRRLWAQTARHTSVNKGSNNVFLCKEFDFVVQVQIWACFGSHFPQKPHFLENQSDLWDASSNWDTDQTNRPNFMIFESNDFSRCKVSHNWIIFQIFYLGDTWTPLNRKFLGVLWSRKKCKNHQFQPFSIFVIFTLNDRFSWVQLHS